MKIGIIGTGKIGGNLGQAWAGTGHDIIFGSRDPGSDAAKELVQKIGSKARATSIKEAAAAGEVLVLAVPWTAAKDTVAECGDVSGKIVMDPTNPIESFEQLAVGHTTSAAEEIAGWAKGARVVKAFNITGSANILNPKFDGHALDMFICGDAAEAKSTVTKLIQEINLDVVDVGPLNSARLLEPLGLIWVRLAYAQGLGPDMGFKVLKK